MYGVSRCMGWGASRCMGWADVWGEGLADVWGEQMYGVRGQQMYGVSRCMGWGASRCIGRLEGAVRQTSRVIRNGQKTQQIPRSIRRTDRHRHQQCYPRQSSLMDTFGQLKTENNWKFRNFCSVLCRYHVHCTICIWRMHICKYRKFNESGCCDCLQLPNVPASTAVMFGKPTTKCHRTKCRRTQCTQAKCKQTKCHRLPRHKMKVWTLLIILHNYYAAA